MKSIIVIIPYFGSLPNYFNLWLSSCRYNSTIDWLLMTDNEVSIGSSFPANVRVQTITWEQMREKVQRIFDFRIALDTPYKLCDFKPAYGEIFREDVLGYDFWAYGDMDVIYGDIRKFITDELLSKYDRCLACGHLSLIRNVEAVNTIYKNVGDKCFYYKAVFSSPDSFTFDEWGRNGFGGYNQICNEYNIPMFNRKIYADIDVRFKSLKCDYGGTQPEIKKEYKKRKVRFSFNAGKLFQIWKKGQKEVLYIHLQKRKMKNMVSNDNVFYIFGTLFSDRPDIMKQSIKEFGLNAVYIRTMFRKVFSISKIKRKLEERVRG